MKKGIRKKRNPGRTRKPRKNPEKKPKEPERKLIRNNKGWNVTEPRKFNACRQDNEKVMVDSFFKVNPVKRSSMQQP